MKDAFSLVELLVVLAIISILVVLAVPSLGGLQSAGGVNQASYALQGALEGARSYATANNTYVWVGFFEENSPQSSSNPAVAGTGRVVIATVASSDGTMIYSPSALTSTATALSGSRLLEVNKLLKINDVHLKTFAVGSGTGSTFLTRPAVIASPVTNAQIGDTSPPTTYSISFPFPLSGTAQYTFTKVIQFSPRGEAAVTTNTAATSYPLTPIVEIGLQPTHGTTINTSNENNVAVQLSGIEGNVVIYRQ